MENKTKIVLLRKSLLQSILTDMFTFGFLAITFWFNYTFIGGNNFIDVLLISLFFIFIVPMSKPNKFYNKEDAIDFIKNN